MWDLLVRSAGTYGVSIKEIYSWSPRELANYQIGALKRYTYQERGEWERARFGAMIVVNPKNFKKFPWEKTTMDEMKKMIASNPMPKKMPKQFLKNGKKG